MKVIFLDHDGVICLSSEWGSRSKKEGYRAYRRDEPHHPADRFDNFNRKAVKVLNEILEETNAEIVISSDWKLYCTLEEMREVYEKHGISKLPIDFTPNMKQFDKDAFGLFMWKGWLARVRTVEIRKWMEGKEIEKWVAVDDLNMGFEGLENFVLTPRSLEGIKQSGIKKKIINFLK